VAESVADRLITVPNHATLSGSDIDGVAHIFLSTLQTWRNAQRAQVCVLDALRT
jgi:hypothetical protein